MKRDDLRLLFRLRAGGCLVGALDVGDLHLHALLLFLPPTAVVCFVVVLELERVVFRAEIPVLFPQTA